MSARPLVSVVTATYNTAQYVALSVRSALAQTYPSVEVHVVDDGSTDDTQEVLKQFAGDPRVHVHHFPNNGGQARAKNHGIRCSRGKYLAFLDADDMWKPGKLERQVPVLEAEQDTAVVYTDLECIDREGAPVPAPIRRYYEGWITERLLVDNFVNFNTTVVRRASLDAVGLFDETLPMGIDWELWLRLSVRYRFRFVPERTMYYRVWPGQMSHNADRRFDCTREIMRRFARGAGRQLPTTIWREAWSDTYASYARKLSLQGRRGAALKWAAAAVCTKPTYSRGWRVLGRAVLG